MMAPDGKISLALNTRKPGKANTSAGIKRSHAATLQGPSDDHEPELGKAETVSHFDKAAGGAIDEANRKPQDLPLVIAPQGNRDWKEASKWNKRRQTEVAAESRRQHVNGRDAATDEREKKAEYGLIVRSRGEEDVAGLHNGHDALPEAAAEQGPDATGDTPPRRAQTDDELAMDALLGRRPKSELVLPALTEEVAFQRDYTAAPAMASLDDYARVPVEQFGAALLRGMGWKEGEGIGSQRGKIVPKTKALERRPALLGIGAKEEAAVAEEMGAWGRGAKKGREVKIYNPVLLRDKKTGEMFTEEELQRKKETAEREKYEAEFEKREREKERRHKRDDDDDGDGRNRDRRDRERRSERDRKDGRDSRDRRREESDDERYYRRRKEREREDRRREFDRSRTHDGDRERHREHGKHREREREKDRRR